MVQPDRRQRNPEATRGRIIDAALRLFTSRGFAATTIEEIAAGAGVGRRTVFNHFDSKQAILFDHLRTGRRAMIGELARRPADEPPLRSLHLVLRARADTGFDRALLHQIRSALAGGSELVPPEQAIGGLAFQHELVAALAARPDATTPEADLKALVAMACGWFATAVHLYLVSGEGTLLHHFDRVVAACTGALPAVWGALTDRPDSSPDP